MNAAALIAAGVMALLGTVLLAINLWTALLPGIWVYVPVPWGLAVGLTILGFGFTQVTPVVSSFLISGLALEILFRFGYLPHGV